MRKTRNQVPFSYCLYDYDIPILDEYGNDTGEKIVVYKPAAQMYASISPATGQSNTEQFGNLDNYDKVIVTFDMSCPIDENSVLFIDKAPAYTEISTYKLVEGYALYADDSVEADTISVPAYDYTVRRVAKSLNSIAIAVKKVEVS